MYEPSNKQDPKYFVFKHVSGRIIPGFGPKQYVVVISVLLVGFMLFMLFGEVKKTEIKELSLTERTVILDEYKLYRNQVFSIELGDDQISSAVFSEGPARYVVVEPDPALRERILQEAAALGIDGLMRDATLEDLAPTTKEVSVEVIPLFARLVIFVVVPVVCVGALSIEFFQGFTLMREISRWLTWRREQHLFRYKSESFQRGDLI